MEPKIVELDIEPNLKNGKNTNNLNGLEASVVSTNALVKKTLEKDGPKRDSDAFVVDSIKQNQRKEKLEE